MYVQGSHEALTAENFSQLWPGDTRTDEGQRDTMQLLCRWKKVHHKPRNVGGL